MCIEGGSVWLSPTTETQTIHKGRWVDSALDWKPEVLGLNLLLFMICCVMWGKFLSVSGPV